MRGGGSVLPADVELCDECGGSELRAMDGTDAVLIGRTGHRRVAFAVGLQRSFSHWPLVRWRGAARYRSGRLKHGSTVHRRHALIEHVDETWYLTHEGQNPLVLQRGRETQVLRPGQTTVLLPEDGVIVGKVLLQFVAPKPA